MLIAFEGLINIVWSCSILFQFSKKRPLHEQFSNVLLFCRLYYYKMEEIFFSIKLKYMNSPQWKQFCHRVQVTLPLKEVK